VGGTAIALLGDAAHTAHFSVGSGTKMAMEDAVTLAASLDEHPGDVDAALVAYETTRQPQVAKIQDSARPSLSWWEHFGRSYDTLPPWQFAYHFFTRSLPESKLRRRDDSFVEDVHARWRDSHHAEPLDSPLEIGADRLAGRTVQIVDGAVVLDGAELPLRSEPGEDSAAWGLWINAPAKEAELPAALDLIGKAVAAGSSLVAVGGGTTFTRRLLCEAARLEHGTISLLVEDTGPDRADDVAVTAVLSGRADLVSTTSRPDAL
jgi:anthraniloyl-CoA monooxygenase